MNKFLRRLPVIIVFVIISLLCSACLNKETPAVTSPTEPALMPFIDYSPIPTPKLTVDIRNLPYYLQLYLDEEHTLMCDTGIIPNLNNLNWSEANSRGIRRVTLTVYCYNAGPVPMRVKPTYNETITYTDGELTLSVSGENLIQPGTHQPFNLRLSFKSDYSDYSFIRTSFVAQATDFNLKFTVNPVP